MAFSTHDIVFDSPTNNFCTLNPLTVGINKLTWTLADGNLHHYGQGNSTAMPTIIPSTQPIYFEFIDLDSPTNWYLAFSQDYDYLSNNNFYGSDAIYVGASGTTAFSISTQGNATFTATVDSTSFSYTQVIGVYANPVTLQIQVYAGAILVKDFVLVNTFTSGKPLMICPSGPITSGQSFSIYVNFGQDPFFGGAKSPSTTYTDANGIGAFYYQPPTGALALCTANLPDLTPDVTGDVPQDYFKTVLYTGNGSTQSITGVGFQPDFVWIKNRSAVLHHVLTDSVRGANNALYSSTTNAEYNSTFNLTSFDSDGFSVGSGTNTNGSGNAIVASCFRAGGAPTADNSNTSGAMTANSVSLNGTLQSNYTPAGSPTIYPTRMSINTDAGFSIVSYTGTGANATVPHGLSQAPDMVIIKNRTNGGAADQWYIWHSGLSGSNYFVELDSANAEATQSTLWAGPFTSTVFDLKSNNGVNGSSDAMIAYCWHSVDGYSKFGSYTGNGSTDGPFIYTGFRVGWLMVKRTDSANSWLMMGSQRSPYNYADDILWADLSDAEAAGGTTTSLDLLSNGFKLRGSGASINTSSGTYIFMAFAEQPFKFSNAR